MALSLGSKAETLLSSGADLRGSTCMQRIVVVGGGTGGWMAAVAISGRFPEKQVTVLDPSAIGPIGVGESVTGLVLAFVTDPLHGLSVSEFVRRCDVTFKTG